MDMIGLEKPQLHRLANQEEQRNYTTMHTNPQEFMGGWKATQSKVKWGALSISCYLMINLAAILQSPANITSAFGICTATTRRRTVGTQEPP